MRVVVVEGGRGPKRERAEERFEGEKLTEGVVPVTYLGPPSEAGHFSVVVSGPL